MSENNNKDDDNLGSFYMGRMRNPPEPRRILPKGMLTVVTVLAFGAIIWYAYPQGQEKFASLNVPTITADKSAYKFKPEDPGGMEVPHQDSTVFDPIDKKSATAAIEKLGAPPEEPVDKDSVLSTSPAIPKKMEKLNLDMQIKEVTAGTEKLVKTDASKVEPAAGEDETAVSDGEESMTAKSDDEKEMPPGVESVKEEPLKTEEAAPLVTDEPKAVEKKVDETKPESIKAEPVKTEPVKKAEEPVKEKPKAVEAKKPTPLPAPTPAVAKKDGIYIQLGSYRDLTAAKADWAKLQKKYPQSIGKMTMHTERADLGAKGVFHRLQAKTASEARAKQICTVLKSSGDPDCIVVR